MDCVIRVTMECLPLRHAHELVKELLVSTALPLSLPSLSLCPICEVVRLDDEQSMLRVLWSLVSDGIE